MFTQISGKKINYTKTGKGKPTILMVHGWSGSSISLKKLAEMLSEHATIIVIDLPGHGRSGMPDPDWGVDQFAELVEEFIVQQKIKKCIYFGHSFGGALGVCLASKPEPIISQLVVCAPSYKRSMSKTSGLITIVHSKVRKFNFLPPWAKKLYYRILFPSSELFKMPKLEANFRKIVSQDLSKLTHRIHIPTLILWGDQDEYVKIADAETLHDNIEGSVLQIFGGKNHGLPINDPELVFAHMKSFLGI